MGSKKLTSNLNSGLLNTSLALCHTGPVSRNDLQPIGVLTRVYGDKCGAGLNYVVIVASYEDLQFQELRLGVRRPSKNLHIVPGYVGVSLVVRAFERASSTLCFTPPYPSMASSGVIMTHTPHPSRLRIPACALSIANADRSAEKEEQE